MLGSEYRLKGDKDFERVKKEGKLFQNESFGLVVLARGDQNPSRFGFIISTKISKDAVRRNRIKRILGEAVRHLGIYLKSGFDCIFLGKPTIVNKYSDELTAEVKQSLEKAGLIT